MAEAKKIRVTQIKSTIGYAENQERVIKALGLGKIGRYRDHYDTPEIRRSEERRVGKECISRW